MNDPTSSLDSGVEIRPWTNHFIDAPESACDVVWESWPSIASDAMKQGHFLLWYLFPAVGNLFIALSNAIMIASFLELGLILEWKARLPGFREAFEPSDIMWDVGDTKTHMLHAAQVEAGGGGTGLHAMTFNDGAIILTEAQLARLTSTVDINTPHLSEVVSIIHSSLQNRPPNLRFFMAGLVLRLKHKGYRKRVDPCAWNMLLRRSPTLLSTMEKHNPWARQDDTWSRSSGHPELYAAWHIRTPDGESRRSYRAHVHTYVIQESSAMVCSGFEEAMTGAAKEACSGRHWDSLPIYISSNSKAIVRNCTEYLANHTIQAGYVDLGLTPDEVHTKTSGNPKTVMNAFLDHAFLMDATVIVRTSSSFSGTVVGIKGLRCRLAPVRDLVHREIVVCRLDSSC